MRALRIGFPFRTNDFPFSALTHSFTRRNCLTVQGPGWTLGNSDAWMSFEGGTAERATRAPGSRGRVYLPWPWSWSTVTTTVFRSNTLLSLVAEIVMVYVRPEPLPSRSERSLMWCGSTTS